MSYYVSVTFKTHDDWKRLLPALKKLAELLGGGTCVRGEEGEEY